MTNPPFSRQPRKLGRLPFFIQPRKPNRHEWCRVHPSPDMQMVANILFWRNDRMHYLVTPEIAAALGDEAVLMKLYTVLNHTGGLFLWLVRQPDERGRLDSWNASAHAAAEIGMTRWVRVVPHMATAQYDCFDVEDPDNEPIWPVVLMAKLVEQAFKGRLIDSLDHPVVRQILGEF